MRRKAVIFGIRGIKLTPDERHLLKTEKPWGIILFSRNIKNLFQLKILIDDIKKSIKDKNYPILIDQEGGRISRLNKIIDLSLFSQDYFGELYKYNKKLLIPFATSPIKEDILPLPKRRTTNTTTIAICQKPMLIINLYTIF